MLSGGAGSDTFAYKAASDRGTTGDVISDFSKVGDDVLDLHEVLESFSGYNGSNAFSGGYLQLTPSNGDTLVQIDADGGANAFLTLAALTNAVLAQTDTANLVL
jgi:hypothetical protein